MDDNNNNDLEVQSENDCFSTASSEIDSCNESEFSTGTESSFEEAESAQKDSPSATNAPIQGGFPINNKMDDANNIDVDVQEDIDNLCTEPEQVPAIGLDAVGASANTGFFHETGPHLPTLHPSLIRQFKQNRINEMVVVKTTGKAPEKKLCPTPTIELFDNVKNVLQNFEPIMKNSHVLDNDGKKWIIAMTHSGEYIRKDMSATDPNRYSRGYAKKTPANHSFE